MPKKDERIEGTPRELRFIFAVKTQERELRGLKVLEKKFEQADEKYRDAKKACMSDPCFSLPHDVFLSNSDNEDSD